MQIPGSLRVCGVERDDRYAVRFDARAELGDHYCSLTCHLPDLGPVDRRKHRVLGEPLDGFGATLVEDQCQYRGRIQGA